jgi:DNA-binding CsgD family transcriptional regulator
MEPRPARDLLVEFITSVYEEPNEAAPAPSSVAYAPHPLLKGWLIVEKVPVGSSEYILLRTGKAPHVRQAGWSALTKREREALHLACSGASNKEIAYEMRITASTVGVMLGRASRKFAAADRGDLVRRARGVEAYETRDDGSITRAAISTTDSPSD